MTWTRTRNPRSTRTSLCWRHCSEPGRGRARVSTPPSTTSPTSSRSPSPTSANRSWPTRQRTRHPETSAPMHAETGYLRVPRPGSIEIVMAQPTGLAEIYEGAVVGGDAPLVIDARSTSINATPTRQGGHDHRTDHLGHRRRPPLHVPHGCRRPAAPAPPQRHAAPPERDVHDVPGTMCTSHRVHRREYEAGAPGWSWRSIDFDQLNTT